MRRRSSTLCYNPQNLVRKSIPSSRIPKSNRFEIGRQKKGAGISQIQNEVHSMHMDSVAKIMWPVAEELLR
jgi:hypothetical protein